MRIIIKYMGFVTEDKDFLGLVTRWCLPFPLMAPLVWFSYLFGIFRQQALAKERWSICDAISIRAMYMAVLLNVLTHGESDMNLKNKLKLAAIALSHTTNLGKNFDFSKAARLTPL
jgi:hypothetical protein